MGTDGCRYLSSLRWDSTPYFEADKDQRAQMWKGQRFGVLFGTNFLSLPLWGRHFGSMFVSLV